MQQPALTWHVIIAITSAEGQVRHLQLHLLIPVEGGVLAHARRSQKETTGRASLDVTLRKGGGIGEAAAVEDVEGIQVQRLYRQQAVGQFYALHALMVVPASEVLGILIDDVKTETTPIAVEVQFIVAVFAHQLGRIE